MSKVIQGRFTDEQVSAELIQDIVSNENITDVVAICKFKDGSMDLYGSMGIKDLCHGLKAVEEFYISSTLNEEQDS